MTEEKNKPVAKGKSGGVEVALWKNKSKKSNKEYYLLGTIQKNYKPKGSTEWSKTKMVFASDIENLITALQTLKEEANKAGIATRRTNPDEIE